VKPLSTAISGLCGQKCVSAPSTPSAENHDATNTQVRPCGKYNPAIHHRRSIRLQGYDYSRAGAYFVTMCTQNRECLFGEIVNGEMRLTDAGKMIQAVWDEIPAHYPGIDIDSFIVMPNHIHGIFVIVGATPGRPVFMQAQQDGQTQGSAPTGLTLPDLVHRFKTMTTKRYADSVKQNGWPPFPGKLWQRNYWEHIVRNEPELNRIREYIHNNPVQWKLEKSHPNNAARSGLKSDLKRFRKSISEYGAET